MEAGLPFLISLQHFITDFLLIRQSLKNYKVVLTKQRLDVDYV